MIIKNIKSAPIDDAKIVSLTTLRLVKNSSSESQSIKVVSVYDVDLGDPVKLVLIYKNLDNGKIYLHITENVSNPTTGNTVSTRFNPTVINSAPVSQFVDNFFTFGIIDYDTST